MNQESPGYVQPQELVQEFASPDGRRRQRARAELVAMGHAATSALLVALDHANWRVRWEAAKTLGEIADPAAIDALILALRDDDPQIRWLAGEALVATGSRSVSPLLKALVAHGDRTEFREAAHFVLRSLETRTKDGQLQPVLDAMGGIEPSIEVPIAALDALVRMVENPRR